MTGTYLSAVAVCLAALVLGRAVCVRCGHGGDTWLAAPVGFAALMVICQVAVSLPGHGWTAVVVLLVLLGVAVWSARGSGRPDGADLVPVAAALLAMATVPFLANGRVGVLGISFLNDTHWHLLLAQGLLEPSIRHLDTYGVGYPLGPHAISAVFAQGLGTSVDRSLTGELMATPVLTGLAALGLLGGLDRTRRWVVAVAAGIPYLAAASYVQSAFKEPILSLLLIGLVLCLDHGRRTRWRAPGAVLVPAAVLLAGVLYDYSYPGLVWPAAILVCWFALELVGRRSLVGLAAGTRAALPAVGFAALVLIILIAPDLHRLHAFYAANGGSSVGTTGGVSQSSLANLAGPLRSVEGLNLWLWGDFRFSPAGHLAGSLIPDFALAVVVLALALALARREAAWIGAMAGCFLVYAYAKHAQSPYVAAKALAVSAPLLVLGVGSLLLRPFGNGFARRALGWSAAAVGALFLILSFESDLLVLRDAQVGPSQHTAELRGLRPLLHGRPTLVLFYDDYFKWELLGVPASSPLLPSPTPVNVDLAKPWTYGQPLDFDSIAPDQLDQFDYVITTRSLAQSQAPSNFHLVGSSRSYEVFHRIGPTPNLQVLPESGHPGAVLDCRTPAGAAVARQAGVAAVRTPPVYAPVGPLAPGGSEPGVLHLSPGRWQISLPFTSPQPVRVDGSGIHITLPPNLDRIGSLWPVGTVVSTGAPITLRLSMTDLGAMQTETPLAQYFVPQSLVAVPDVPDRTVPLRAACGRYVDHYELSG